MKKYLLPKSGNFYKANLHCHTNISDGMLSPEQVKKLYADNGYSIVAFTDHDVFLTHNDLTDENFLALNGYEWEIYENYPTKNYYNRTFHACLIAKNDKLNTPVLFHREKYFIGNGVKYVEQINYDKTLPDYEREYTAECANTLFKEAKKAGFFTTYNHPTWSGETYREYMNYIGMDAMEIYNCDCNMVGFDEYNPRVYEDMLRDGKRIFCIAADDNHNKINDMGGFIMLKSDKLDYQSVINSLVNGYFYSSNGPLIKELYLDGDTLYITTAPVSTITLTNAIRRGTIIRAKDGEQVTEAQFKVSKEDKFIRITIKDKNGKFACTNAYFMDELLK